MKRRNGHDLRGVPDAPVGVDLEKKQDHPGVGRSFHAIKSETHAISENAPVDLPAEAIVDGLSPREREILEGRFGLHDRETQTLEVLSVRLGLTRERVRQI